MSDGSDVTVVVHGSSDKCEQIIGRDMANDWHIIQVNSDDADVVFKSCDHVIFKIHRKNLEACTGGFPPAEFETHEEIVPLTEPSSTLELLFQYVYPMPQPEILSAPFETIEAVAEAAEKYQVYPAMYICRVSMGCAPISSPKETLAWTSHLLAWPYQQMLPKYLLMQDDTVIKTFSGKPHRISLGLLYMRLYRCFLYIS